MKLRDYSRELEGYDICALGKLNGCLCGACAMTEITKIRSHTKVIMYDHGKQGSILVE